MLEFKIEKIEMSQEEEIDVDILKSGQKYKDLKTSFVIFICIDDIFEDGLPKYTFENLCAENPKIKLNDRAYKHFFISKNCDKLLNEDQKAFLRMVTGGKASNKFTGHVEELLRNAKRNAQWRKQFMDLEREKTYAFDRGMEQKALEAALTLIRDFNVSPDVAAQKMGAPLDKVLEALKDVAVTA